MRGLLGKRMAVFRLWRQQSAFLPKADFCCDGIAVVCGKLQKRFGMYENNEEYRLENFEKLTQELLDILFPVCEVHRRGHTDEYAKALPLAAMAVQESIRTFLALLKRT